MNGITEPTVIHFGLSDMLQWFPGHLVQWITLPQYKKLQLMVLNMLVDDMVDDKFFGISDNNGRRMGVGALGMNWIMHVWLQL